MILDHSATLAYGGQNVGLSAELKPAYGGQYHKVRKTGFALKKKVQGRKSKFGSDIHTPGHIEYLHTKFHHRTTSNKKVQKTGFAPISRQKWSRALVLKIDFWNIWWFHMLGNEPEILDSKFEDDTTLSLWTNQKVRKTGFAPIKRARGRKSKF